MHTNNTPSPIQNPNSPSPPISPNLPNQISDPRINQIRTENLNDNIQSTAASLAGRGTNPNNIELKRAIEELQAGFYVSSSSQIQDWFNKNSKLFDSDQNVNDLSHLDCIHLASLLSRIDLSLSSNIESKVKKRIEAWPLGAQFQNHVNRNLKSFVTFLDTNDISTEEKYFLLSIYVQKHEIPILDLKKIPEIDWEAFSPYLRYLDLREVEETSFIEKLVKNCKNSQVLHLNNDKIKRLETLPNLQMLDCQDCKSLTDIGIQPSLQKLDSSKCPALKKIDTQPSLQELNCSKCTGLKKIDTQPSLRQLNCQKCKYLDQIGIQPNLQRLNCAGCKRLPRIRIQPSLKELNCQGCISLITISAQPNLQRLNCQGCTALIIIAAQPSLQGLFCQNCTALPQIGTQPNLQRLDCQGCITLTQIGTQPSLQMLNCEGCTALQGLPELPFNAVVYSDGTPQTKYTKLEINLEDLDKQFGTPKPKEVLLKLGREYLLQKKPFPNIYYFLHGVRDAAIDVGGVRRDFITRMGENLFKEEGAGFLSIKNGFSIIQNEDDKDSYRTLGRLFALCYPHDSYFKTGPLFSEKVYNCLAASADPGSEEWLLASYLHYISAPVRVHQYIDVHKDMPLFGQEDIEQLSWYTNIFTPSGDLSRDQDFLVRQESRTAVKQELLGLARKLEKDLSAVSYMAKEMKSSLGEVEWIELCKKGPKELKERIEGIISTDAVLNKLEWAPSPAVSPKDTEKTKGYLQSWIGRSDRDQLGKFVRAVSSSNTLSEHKLNMEIVNRGEKFIPVAHTCFFTLELSANYPSQKHFDDKLNLFLAEGMAGSGFQIA